MKIKAMRKLRVIYSDPDATDCSSDEEEDESRRDKKSIGLKRVIHQIDLDLGTFDSSEDTKSETVSKQKDEPIDSPCSVLESECSEDSGGLELKQSSHISNCEEFNSRLMELGSLIIDNNGFLLGEFSRLDDLWICDMKTVVELVLSSRNHWKGRRFSSRIAIQRFVARFVIESRLHRDRIADLTGWE
ncbi:unnamed protein product [Camellia sinensis]